MTELIEAHNAYRATRSLPPLVEDDRLTAAAQGHAEWMHSKNKMSHSQGWFGKSMTARVKATGYPYTGVGENIAAGQRTVEDVMDSWIHSRGHRANILGKFEHIGVARVGNFWCVVFGRSS